MVSSKISFKRERWSTKLLVYFVVLLEVKNSTSRDCKDYRYPKQKLLFCSSRQCSAAFADEQQSIRKRALAMISHSIRPKKERNFVLPKINHSAEHYFDLSHFESEI